MSAQRPLPVYYAAISAALNADDVQAVPGLLTLMALDGHGHEAETLRRLMSAAAAMTGDLDAWREGEELATGMGTP